MQSSGSSSTSLFNRAIANPNNSNGPSLAPTSSFPGKTALQAKYAAFKDVTNTPNIKVRLFPYSLPEGVSLSATNEVPIQERARYRGRDDRSYDLKRNVGKASLRAEGKLVLDAVPACGKKVGACACNVVVNDLVYQSDMRQRFYEVLKRGESSDAGNLFLEKFICVEPEDSRRDTRHRSAPTSTTKKRVRFNYCLPLPSSEWISVCRATFVKLFGVGTKTLNKVQKRVKDTQQVGVQVTPRGNTGMSATIKEGLIQSLESEPRQTSHYAMNDRDNSRRYYYNGNYSLFFFWKRYLEKFGTEEDKLFCEQARGKKFFPTYHQFKKVKNKPEYTDDDPQRKPSISYNAARRFFNKFDIHFQSRKCDICETCFYGISASNDPRSTNELRAQSKAFLLDHQRSATISVFVRKEWKRFVATNGFRKDHWEIDYAANPRCPYTELGQSFYSRILGICVFIVYSSLTGKAYFYMYDERTAKKGSDEVLSIIFLQLCKYLPKDILELDIHCDGCAGQSWNNRLALLCEDFVDENSVLRKKAGVALKRIDLYRGVSGHTFMTPDTRGGMMQSQARNTLLDRDEGFVHVMVKDAELDPYYTRDWKEHAERCNDTLVVTPAIGDFYKFSDYLLPPEAGGTSTLYSVPSPRSCFNGPHSNNSWRISRCHHINFGIGEKDGKLVAHHGVWFARDTFFQKEADEILVRNWDLLDDAPWKEEREKLGEVLPVQKNNEKMPLSYLKQKDLYGLGKLMSRDKERKDFLKRYPNPDAGGASGSGRTQDDLDEELREVRAILQKNEERLSSGDYYFLIRWGMNHKGMSQYKTKPERKAQWLSLVAAMSEHEQQQLYQVPTSDDPERSLTLSKGADTRQIDEYEHVDDDEHFEVDDVPLFDEMLIRETRERDRAEAASENGLDEAVAVSDEALVTEVLEDLVGEGSDDEEEGGEGDDVMAPGQYGGWDDLLDDLEDKGLLDDVDAMAV